MGLLIDVIPFLKTVPTITEEEISNIKTRKQLAQIIKENNLIDIIPLSIQLKHSFIFLKNVSKRAMKHAAYNEGYSTLKVLIRNTHNANWSYSNNSNMEDNITKLKIDSNGFTNIKEFNIKEVAIYNIYRADIAYDNLIEDFKAGKLQDATLFKLLEQSLKSYYKKNDELEAMVETIKYCYENFDKATALYNMACLSVLVVEFDMNVKKGMNSFFCDKGTDCEIIIANDYQEREGAHCHELGHAIHFKLKNRKIPTNIKRIIEDLSAKNIDIAAEFIKNIDKYYGYNTDSIIKKIDEWRKKYQEFCYNKLVNLNRNNYSVFLEEIKKLCKNEKIYQDLLIDLDFFLPEEKYLSIDEKEYKNKLYSVLDCLFEYNNSQELDKKIIMRINVIAGIIADLLSGIYLDNYTSNGFGLNYSFYHKSDYYYDIDLEIRYENTIFDELFANYNELRMTNQKIPLELVQLLGEELFLNLISIYENIPVEKIDIKKYIATSPIITKEILEYQNQNLSPNRQYFKKSEDTRYWLRLDKIHSLSAEQSELTKQYGAKEGSKIFFYMLLNYYERNVENFDTKVLENLANHSDGEIIDTINKTIEEKDRNGNPIFTDEEKEMLEKRRDEVLYDRVKFLKEEGLLEEQPFLFSYLFPREKATYNNKLFEVDEGYLDYNNPNVKEMEYYKKYIDRLNIEYFANITLEDDNIVDQISNCIYDMFDNNQYDITNIKKVFITKDQTRKHETEEERKEGTLVFRYDESPEEINRRLQEQCKKKVKSK